MRLGAELIDPWKNPEDWAGRHAERGYRAAVCPLQADASDQSIAAYRVAAEAADLLIAETGAWCNLLHPDAATREANLQHNIRCLELAEKIGSRCCLPGSHRLPPFRRRPSGNALLNPSQISTP